MVVRSGAVTTIVIRVPSATGTVRALRDAMATPSIVIDAIRVDIAVGTTSIDAVAAGEVTGS